MPRFCRGYAYDCPQPQNLEAAISLEPDTLIAWDGRGRHARGDSVGRVLLSLKTQFQLPSPPGGYGTGTRWPVSFWCSINLRLSADRAVRTRVP
jgi:hypothetical protein